MPNIEGQAMVADDFMQFHVNVSCLLNMMRRTIVENGPLAGDDGLLAEQAFLGEGYELRLICRQGGARPFLASLEKPWRHRVSLGRLDKDGKVRVFSYGVRLFYDFLAEQEILDRFRGDLERALDLHLLGRGRPDGDMDRGLTGPEEDAAPVQ